MYKSKKIGIILVNYNGEKYNNECIDSILESTYENYEIIVVDNDSKDNSVKILEERYSDKITLFKNKHNSGFSEANNIGIEIAKNKKCDYILLLNNDTVIMPDCIEVMLKSSIDNCNSVVSPKIYYYDDKELIWSAGAKMLWKKGLAAQTGINKKDNGEYNKRINVEFATGCCLLIPMEVINKVGFLSTDYFLYYEDTDYCVRIIKEGFNIIYEPEAVLYHKVSASTGGEESYLYIYYNTRNRLIFNSKNNKENITYCLLYFYVTRIAKFVLWLLKGKFELIKASFDAIKDYNNGVIGKKEL